MTNANLGTWKLWSPSAAANGMLFGRARPDDSARRKRARRTRQSTRLTSSGSMQRPADHDLGSPVLLPGGEVGILLSWRNAAAESEWRWQVEFYNQR